MLGPAMPSGIGGFQATDHLQIFLVATVIRNWDSNAVLTEPCQKILNCTSRHLPASAGQGVPVIRERLGVIWARDR
jgi:hypothetical protein